MDDESFDMNVWPAFTDLMLSLVLILTVLLSLMSVANRPIRPTPKLVSPKPFQSVPPLPPGKTREEFLSEELNKKVVAAHKMLPQSVKALGLVSSNTIVFTLLRFPSRADLENVPASLSEGARSLLANVFDTLNRDQFLQEWEQQQGIELAHIQIVARGNLLSEGPYLDNQSVMVLRYITDSAGALSISTKTLARANDYSAVTRAGTPSVSLRLLFRLSPTSKSKASEEYETRSAPLTN